MHRRLVPPCDGHRPVAATARWAELTLVAGEPGLVLLGLEVAQTTARNLRHRILFITEAGAAPINICP
jgi:hypothetical protein